MQRDVIFLWCTCKRERVPLEVGDFGTAEEDVLTGLSGCFFFFDLEFEDVGGVLDDFGDVGAVAGADFAEDTFDDPDDTADEPVAL